MCLSMLVVARKHYAAHTTRSHTATAAAPVCIAPTVRMCRLVFVLFLLVPFFNISSITFIVVVDLVTFSVSFAPAVLRRCRRVCPFPKTENGWEAFFVVIFCLCKCLRCVWPVCVCVCSVACGKDFFLATVLPSRDRYVHAVTLCFCARMYLSVIFSWVRLCECFGGVESHLECVLCAMCTLCIRWTVCIQPLYRFLNHPPVFDRLQI